MSIKIIHQSGPLKGQIHTFDDDKRRISIGRNKNCDIVFPFDFTAIASDTHCEFVKDASSYEARVDTKYRILVNGQQIADDTELQDGDQISLGPDDAATMLLEETRESTAPKTDFQGSLIDDDSSLIDQQRKRTKRLSAIAILLLVAIGLLTVFVGKSDTALKQIAQQIAASKNTPDFQNAIAMSEESLYLVTIVNEDGEESPMGTAWVTENGYLATNAHVAEAVDELLSSEGSGLTALVRKGQMPNDEHTIESVIIHPAYEPFESHWSDYEPLLLNHEGEAETLDFLGGYDVALLKVDNVDTLGPALPLASNEEMREIKRGYPIAFNGFPMENLVNFNPRKPLSNAQTGIITAITDFFRVTSFDHEGELIQHNLPATGGASGSPIFNSNGHVIAILNGGNVLMNADGQRIANGALINFAQRASLIKDLFDVEEIDLTELKTSWTEKLELLDNQESYERRALSPDNIARKWARAMGSAGEAVEVANSKFIIPPVKNAQTEAATIEAVVNLLNPGIYLILAESDTRRDIDLLLARKDIDALSQSESPSEYEASIYGLDDAADHVPYVQIKVSDQATAYAIIFDGGLVDEYQEDDTIQSAVNLHVFYLPFSE